MAEVVVRAEVDRAGLSGRVEVDSAGTGDWHLGQGMDERAEAELARRGYDGTGHRARQIDRSWFGRYDLVLAMDASNLERLRQQAPDAEAAGRTAMLLSFDPDLAGRDADDLEVPDPYYGGDEGFAEVFELIRSAARGLTAQLSRVLTDQPASSG
jgi:protein-tyrosine phosphatase